MTTPAKLTELAERISSRCVVNDAGCMEWQGAKNDSGYGQLWFEGRLNYVHRLSYEASKGPIPNGLCIDHLCRNPRCANPDHLEAVTIKENTRRGGAGMHRRIETAKITHCPQGHPYDEENTYAYRGKRYCKECAKRRLREARRLARAG